MNMRTIGIVIVAVALILAISMTASARPDPEGATVVNNGSETATADAAGNDTAQGGYISNVDLSASSQTVKWQGYFGEIAGTITLQDATGNQMYYWDWVSESGGTVFAVARNDSAPIWTAIYNNDVTRDDVDTVWGYTGSDTANITFDDPDGSIAFDVAGYTVPTNGRDALYTLLQDGTDSAFEEVLLTDRAIVNSTDDFIFACRIAADTANFQNSTSDYQLIVPDTIAADTTTTYYFYVEMS